MTQRGMKEVNAFNLVKYEKEKLKLKLQRLQEQLEWMKTESGEIPEMKAVNKVCDYVDANIS